MKKIYFIARNELCSLFYSPIAWALMVLFLIIISADYIEVTEGYIILFEKGGWGLNDSRNLTSDLTAHRLYGLLHWDIKRLYLFLPLIFMGLISRETGSGTIKLLYSSPIKIREIVLGKYLAMLCFTLCLIILISFTLIALSMSITAPDYVQLLASLFGVFIVLSTYAAIGLFISSLTSYPIVAALITFGVFALFSHVGELWQDVDLIRHITHYMNIKEKSSNLVSGFINLRDFSYFMVVIISFLSFTIIRIKSATESISRFKKASRYVAVIAAAFIIAFITQKPGVNVYFDATRNQRHTITPPIQNLLSKLNNGELEITLYANLLDGSYDACRPSHENKIMADLWEPYIRFKPDIRVNFVHYYNGDSTSSMIQTNPDKTLKEIAKATAKSYKLPLSKFLGPEEVSKMVDTKAEDYRSFFVLKYKGKTAIARTFNDIVFWPNENEVAAAINRLVATPPQIAFLSDEIERGPISENPRDYKVISGDKSSRWSLTNQGYDVDTLSLRKNDIPSDLAGLVIADPRTTISPENLKKINSYIDAGGNLFIASEPDRIDITRPLFEKLGLSLRKGMLIQPGENYASDVAFVYLTDTAVNLSPQLTHFVKEQIRFYQQTVMRVAMPGASVIDYQEKDGFKIQPLLVSDDKLSWNRLAPISNDSLQRPVVQLPTDQKGSFVTAVKMRRNINGREQRIIVASDADYLSQKGLNMSNFQNKLINYEFGFWCFSTFTYGQFPANTVRQDGLDNSFKIKRADMRIQRIMLYGILPFMIAILGSVILIRRQRK